MGKPSKRKLASPRGKPVGWRIPPQLRRELASHAKAMGDDVELVVAKWLRERLQAEAKERARRTLATEHQEP